MYEVTVVYRTPDKEEAEFLKEEALAKARVDYVTVQEVSD